MDEVFKNLLGWAVLLAIVGVVRFYPWHALAVAALIVSVWALMWLLVWWDRRRWDRRPRSTTRAMTVDEMDQWWDQPAVVPPHEARPE